MKKLGFLAMMVALGGVAFASSLAVPWFVDNAPAACNNPPNLPGGEMGIVTLKSNVDRVMTCAITYYNSAGERLGPDAPNNTFTIAPMSALAFRPVANDPGTAGGQEGAQGLLVPNRPMGVVTPTYPSGDNKKNGSITIMWDGDPTDIQGQYAYFNTSTANQMNSSYGHLLPPGV